MKTPQNTTGSWIIIDSAPTDGRRLLLSVPWAGVLIGYYSAGRWLNEDGEAITSPSHWMSIPARVITDDELKWIESRELHEEQAAQREEKCHRDAMESAFGWHGQD